MIQMVGIIEAYFTAEDIKLLRGYAFEGTLLLLDQTEERSGQQWLLA